MDRCPWCLGNELLQTYHDEEWGTPVHEEQKHFEFLVLESMQAGLSWMTILNKRENFRKALSGFNPVKIVKYKEEQITSLLANPGIIRNRRKIEAVINNAARFLEIQKEFKSFDAYIWGFVNYKPVHNQWKKQNELPVTTELSDKISKDLKKRGFKFVGSTTIYAHIQAIGLVNDHLISCFRHARLMHHEI
ncbi:MAG: DNA-3-methyladenine glycosylase I [Spirochaetales bacterium]|nr:DNA-3-methyladenine glycosylase I [Spirochaetales bacterium]